MYSLTDCPHAHEVGVQLSRQHILTMSLKFTGRLLLAERL